MEDAQHKIEAWREGYNHFRPCISLGDKTPEEWLQHNMVEPEFSTSDRL
ncbi:integrase core domain-containing protein [Pontibacter sp. CAU 1760]